MRLFEELKNDILNYLIGGLDSGDLSSIKSLEINKRKPHTKRLFFHLGEERVCLHDFEPCKESESFPHPHSWESQIKILRGSYTHCILYGVPLDKDFTDKFDSLCITSELSAGNSYHIDTPDVWHKVTPKTKVSTVMINGPIWEVHNDFCKFTKGKELKSISDKDKTEMILRFINLIKDYETN